MKLSVVVAAIAGLSLASCMKPAGGAAGAPVHARYVGVGIYPAGRMWSQMVVANAPSAPALSKTGDDEQVIVVVDSNTGEIRQCGNLSGYCIGMSPWAQSLAAQQTAPVALTKHAADLDAQASATPGSSSPHGPTP